MLEIQIRGLERSYSSELDDFFDSISSDGIAITIPSNSAFCQARKKLKHTAFIELDKTITHSFYCNNVIKAWHNHRLIAIDGSMAHVPDTAENIAHFGAYKPSNGDLPCPKARLSLAYDPLNKLIVDAIISPKAVGEYTMAKQHLESLQKGDLCLYDRGYASYELMSIHNSKNMKFCMRIPVDKFTVLCEDLEAGEDDVTIYYQPSPGSKRICKESGLPTDGIKLRLLKIELDNGEMEVLATNIFDARLTLSSFKDLYHLRWGVEEEYKRIKSRAELEAYSGKLSEFVYQDFYADIIRLNLSSILAMEAKKVLSDTGRKRKYKHAPNMSFVLTKTRTLIGSIVHKGIEFANIMITSFTQRIIRCSEPIRPGRRFPRTQKPFRSGYYMEYKLARS